MFFEKKRQEFCRILTAGEGKEISEMEPLVVGLTAKTRVAFAWIHCQLAESSALSHLCHSPWDTGLELPAPEKTSYALFSTELEKASSAKRHGRRFRMDLTHI
ncbi:hypothetical protein NPIL_570021 [Nephila pilipes]|uniref:Uncharacterized protein n=1 Tax=Nephila pilipes TaxID=299642 RepID=A0A8X6PZU5_NEPPI|nr:hypothetical protein NPIL_570021 [Nephila pilipes]